MREKIMDSEQYDLFRNGTRQTYIFSAVLKLTIH
jgi:hypothetical protein